LSAKPLEPYGPAALELATLLVVVGLAIVPFLSDPLKSVPETLDSFASGQPSPSESKSNLLGMPSLSLSIS
jgi:hypothetical protein